MGKLTLTFCKLDETDAPFGDALKTFDPDLSMQDLAMMTPTGDFFEGEEEEWDAYAINGRNFGKMKRLVCYAILKANKYHRGEKMRLDGYDDDDDDDNYNDDNADGDDDDNDDDQNKNGDGRGIEKESIQLMVS